MRVKYAGMILLSCFHFFTCCYSIGWSRENNRRCLNEEKSNNSKRFLVSDEKGKLNLDGFTLLQDEQFLVYIKESFVVQKVSGSVFHGEFKEDQPLEDVLIELRGPEPLKKVIGVKTDSKGHFQIDNVPLGKYTFKTSFCGFQPIVGIIIVSNEAELNTSIILRLKVDE